MLGRHARMASSQSFLLDLILIAVKAPSSVGSSLNLETFSPGPTYPSLLCRTEVKEKGKFPCAVSM